MREEVRCLWKRMEDREECDVVDGCMPYFHSSRRWRVCSAASASLLNCSVKNVLSGVICVCV